VRGGIRRGIVPVLARFPPATVAADELVAKFSSLFFPSRTANASVIEPCIIFWISSMKVSWSFDESLMSADESPPDDSPDTGVRLRRRAVLDAAGARGALGLGTVADLITVWAFLFAIRPGREAVARTTGLTDLAGFAGFADFRGRAILTVRERYTWMYGWVWVCDRPGIQNVS